MIFHRILFILIAALAPVGRSSSGQSPDLERYLSAPFRSRLTASPGGERIAWIDQVLGERAIMVADAPDFSPRRLAHVPDDDGLAVSGLTFAPDGGTVLFTHGSGRVGHTFTPCR